MFTPQHQQLSPNRASINMQSPQASNLSRGIFQRGGFATNPGADRRNQMPGITSLMQEWFVPNPKEIKCVCFKVQPIYIV